MMWLTLAWQPASSTGTSLHHSASLPCCPQERDQAAQLFAKGAAGAQANGTAAAGNTFEPDEDFAAVQQQRQEEGEGGEQAEAMETEQQAAAAAAAGGPMKLSAQQTSALQAAIANVQTLEEVRRIEEALKSGYMPSGFEFGADGSLTENGAAPMDQG